MRHTKPIYENVTISAVAAEGKALARVGDLVVFVPWAVPGDVVDIQVTRKKKTYCEGRVMRYITLSAARVAPRCQHFGICGGCKWQMLPYPAQLAAKEQQVVDQLTRIGKVSLPAVRPIIGSEKEYEYRNKLEFAFSNRRWLTADEVARGETLAARDALGFHISGAWDKIYPIECCHLMPPLHNDIRNAIRDYALEHNLSFYDVRNNCGLLRDVIIRHSNNDEWMVIFQFRFSSADDERQAQEMMGAIAARFPQVTAMMYVDNQKCNDTMTDLPVQLFAGSTFITERMGDLRFKVGAKSFYQTNTLQAERLYGVVSAFVQLTADDIVYDLYTGTGTIANFVARSCRRVIGIEYVPEAIEDAKTNSQLNDIDNTEFFAGDMKDILTAAFIRAHGHPDVIITDPPRAGMHGDVVQAILFAAPRRIVYVSCNPATQARDVALLDSDYRVSAIQPVDMFPHTPHVENVILLEKR